MSSGIPSKVKLQAQLASIQHPVAQNRYTANVMSITVEASAQIPMRETTFNTLAIAIFLVTLTSLLGPLVNLSPVVPALATAGLLGLVTVDQLGLNGSLGQIAMDGLARTSADYRQRVLHHEAGHFLVAALLQVPVVDYSLNAWDAWRRGLPGQGGVVFDDQALMADLEQGRISRQQINRYCTLWMAGIAAEQWVYGQASGGQDDRQKFQLLWQQLRRPAREVPMSQRWAALQARSLLERHPEAYQALVAAMDQKASVADCYQCMQSHLACGQDQTT
ncbi:hypothetical protein XM38_028490 [Halomicronema hongdechloris C2206]|uniref:ATP-dependent Zn protease n=1 Tax=Halomicronema hongdechloris C2206 TaxID=1641165 RepID=A0A1Z3HNN9_9CYAN|nr:ATP-dependent Zn protease [Halomicronema hongdechloris]ASC71895.1 hypothetical protein XM38_028490 [Halomicronema hongdechloris C2206]